MDDVVDVIVPTRNRVELTVRAVTSVLAQTHRRARILVVDDASDDGAADELARRWRGEERVSLVRRSERGGEALARQSGLDAARAPYVALLDSDDVWIESKLERQLEALRASGADLALCWYEWVSPDGARVQPLRRHQAPGGRMGALDFNNCSAPLVLRSALLAAGGFGGDLAAGLSTCASVELFIRLLQRCQVAVVPEVLVRCLVHPGPRASDAVRTLRAAEELARVLQAHAPGLRLEPDALRELELRVATRYAQAGELAAAARHLSRAWRLSAPRGLAASTRASLYIAQRAVRGAAKHLSLYLPH